LSIQEAKLNEGIIRTETLAGYSNVSPNHLGGLLSFHKVKVVLREKEEQYLIEIFSPAKVS